MINLKRLKQISFLLWLIVAFGLLIYYLGIYCKNDLLYKIGMALWPTALCLNVFITNRIPAYIFELIGLRLAQDLIRGRVIIAEVFEQTPAAKAGLAENQLILEIEKQKIYYLDDAYFLAEKIWKKLETNQPVSIITGVIGRNNPPSEKSLKKE